MLTCFAVLGEMIAVYHIQALCPLKHTPPFHPKVITLQIKFVIFTVYDSSCFSWNIYRFQVSYAKASFVTLLFRLLTLDMAGCKSVK